MRANFNYKYLYKYFLYKYIILYYINIFICYFYYDWYCIIHEQEVNDSDKYNKCIVKLARFDEIFNLVQLLKILSKINVNSLALNNIYYFNLKNLIIIYINLFSYIFLYFSIFFNF